MTAVAVIPARFASTRFPGKPLASQTGKFLIQHVYEQVAGAETIDRVIAAVDDERVADAVASFGGTAVMTRRDHPTGTDRVAEVAADLSCDLVVNVQGDEPEIEPAAIDRLVRLLERSTAPMATLACPFEVTGGDPADPDSVKVVLDRSGHALLFSRSRIPYPRSGTADVASPPLLHLGVYAYRRDFLLRMAALDPTPLERTERLEQLRVLEHGHTIVVGVVDRAFVGIDTPADYSAFVARVERETSAATSVARKAS